MTAIGLAFAASVLWGVGDFFGGLTSRRLAALAVVAISQLFGFGGILVVAAFAGGDFPGLTAVAAPISASAAVIPVTVGLARGERPSAPQLAGVALALFGVVLVSREPGAEWRLSAGVPLALVAALGFGGYFVFMDRASAEDAYWAVLVARGFSSAIALAVAAAWGTLRVGRRNLPVLVAIGLFDVAANLALALALNEGYVSLVSVVAALYPVFTVLLAVVVLHERPARSQALGGAVALTGVGLIAAAA